MTAAPTPISFERSPVRGTTLEALDLDEASRSGHYDVHVDLGPGILLVGQVELVLPIDDSDTDRREVIQHWITRYQTLGHAVGKGVLEGDPRPSDGGSPGPPIGLDHVTVETDRRLTHRLEVNDRAQ